MVRRQYLRTAALVLVWAALLPLSAGRPQPAAAPAKAAAAAAATGPPVNSRSVASRLGQVEGKITSLEENVLKLFARLAVVSGDLRSIVKMLAPVLSPVVSPPAATVRPPPAATARPPPATARPPPATTARPPPVPSVCPAGYSRVGDRSRSRLCLSGLSPQPLAYRAAAERCRTTGGRLLQLENNVKFHLVKGLLPDDRQLWVGATYLAAGKDFFWVAGGQRVQVKVQGVATGGATCAVLVMFRTAGHLAAQSCRSPRYFVCEKTLP